VTLVIRGLGNGMSDSVCESIIVSQMGALQSVGEKRSAYHEVNHSGKCEREHNDKE
jgi:hypothetical protein